MEARTAEESAAAGSIYVLTNRSYPGLVKIGYAKDVLQRVRQLNTGTPYPFQVRCTCRTKKAVADKDVHKIICGHNPDLHVRNEGGGTEFFKMAPEAAFDLLHAYAVNKEGLPADWVEKWPERQDVQPERHGPAAAVQDGFEPQKDLHSAKVMGLFFKLKDSVEKLGGVEVEEAQWGAVFRRNGQAVLTASFMPGGVDAVVGGQAGVRAGSIYRITSGAGLKEAMPRIQEALDAVPAMTSEEASRLAEEAEAGMEAFLTARRNSFRGKTVMLVRESPEWPNLLTAFAERFESLGLKKLIALEPMPDGTGKIFQLCRDVSGNGHVGVHDFEFNRIADAGLSSEDVLRFRGQADIIAAAPLPGEAASFAGWAGGDGRRFVAIGGKESAGELASVKAEGAASGFCGGACWLSDVEDGPAAVPAPKPAPGPRLQDRAAKVIQRPLPFILPFLKRQVAKADPPLADRKLAEEQELQASKNSNLHNAKRMKNDEFYTRFEDVEQEMNSYIEWNKDVFRDKVVLLPCDDPEWSGFTDYFKTNFKKLGLKKLISTCYAGGLGGQTVMESERRSPHYRSDEEGREEGRGKLLVMERDIDGGAREADFQYLEGDGDFRSDEVRKLRDEADFIVTNPPFSLFREFMAWIQEGRKDFIILSNKNAITYKEIFPLLKADKMWLGARPMGQDAYFYLPDDYKKWIVENKQEGSAYKIIDGEPMGRAAVCWFTNVDHFRRHQKLNFDSMKHLLKHDVKLRKKLLQDYGSADAYPRYDNYDAIEVPYVDAIPKDYAGAMGVPITFLDKYNPEQFEILGSFNASSLESKEADGYVPSTDTPTIVNGVEQMWNGPVVNKKPLYKRIVVRLRHPEPQNAPDLPDAAAAEAAEAAEEEDEGLRPGM